MSKGLCSVYSRLFQLHTCNKLGSVYANKLINLVEDSCAGFGINMKRKVELVIVLLDFMTKNEKIAILRIYSVAI